ncbi:thioredoxin-dependent thiol peroxidase [Brevundimonas sp.]|uniref:thioredoxin-dependent thiol peroxidase n=1 Tax=Brevundimonas sp. TaxID=1871086 RepID=UPI002AB85AEB|nr:thioredoxin-dependent thiol peroxidase [Brevundimonas sp.]MDZ4363802.1 thioredoxin-dependent thiol peroxidase [Brevundimonas sp.]
MTEIVQGQKAPEFVLPVDGGGEITSAALKGRTVVLYFYPKADTPGCTNEAKDFTALADQFEAAGVTIIGVSKDPVKKLDRFKAKYDLSVTLASDETAGVTEAYGLWVEKSMYGKTYMGIERATVLIDGEGLIRRVWRKVSVKGHADEVLAAVQSL